MLSSASCYSMLKTLLWTLLSSYIFGIYEDFQLTLMHVNLCRSNFISMAFRSHSLTNTLTAFSLCYVKIVCHRNTSQQKGNRLFSLSRDTHTDTYTPQKCPINKEQFKKKTAKLLKATPKHSDSFPVHIHVFVDEGGAVGGSRESPVQVQVRQVELSATTSGLFISNFHTQAHTTPLPTDCNTWQR